LQDGGFHSPSEFGLLHVNDYQFETNKETQHLIWGNQFHLFVLF
jgi:hypothetical protein